MKYLYCHNPEDDEPIMLINKHIGTDEKEGDGILGDLFQAELLSLERQGKKRVDVWINTVGGSVMHGMNIYGTIVNVNQRGTTQVDTLNVGVAASTGGFIFQAGKRRVMMDYGILMMHNSHTADGEENEDGSEEFNNSIATMLASKNSKPVADVLALMNKTTFMDAQESLINGFCDDVKISGQQVKPFSKKATQKMIWETANKYVNKLLDKTPQNMPAADKINNLLELQDDANENSQVKAIQNILKAKTEAENSLTKLKNEMDSQLKEAKDAMDQKTNEYNDLKGKYDKMVADKETADKEQNTLACKNMVEGFAKTGHIKNDADTIAEWVNTAQTIGVDKAKAMLQKLPLNKVMPVPADETKTDGKVPTNFASAMHNKANSLRNKK